MVATQTYGAQTRVILSPNRSANWQQIKWVVILMTVFVLCIAIAWSLVGAWMVLPFAGIEVGLFGFFMYRVNRLCHSQQVITILDKSIVVECGIESPTSVYHFERNATHLAITEPKSNMDKPQLVLCDDNRHFEIGQFLNQDDSKLAKRTLIANGLIPVSNQWWKQH